MKGLGYITLSEAERLSGIKADTLKKRCQEGMISGAIKQGKTWFVPRSQVIQEQGSPSDDKILSLFATFAEAGIGTSITLFVGGTIIVGDLVPTKIYIEKLKEGLRKSKQKTPVSEEVYGVFEKVLGVVQEGLPKDTAEVLDKQIYAVHIVNVSYCVGGRWESPANAVMRIKLNAIDGFLWGKADRES